jgi:hypothetical protein
MAVERADLSASLSLERMAPVPAAPAVQEQSSPEDGEGKPRHRPPPPQNPAAEPSPESSEEASDPPPHRIDSLA